MARVQTSGTGGASTSGGSGDVTGPNSSTDNAIARWDGTTGSIIQNSKTEVQDGGAVVAQAQITKTLITDSVIIASNNSMVTGGFSIEANGELVIESDAQLVIV